MEITVETVVKADMETVWKAWNTPEDIKEWNAASDDWHTTKSSVDLRPGGKFCSRMEAKDKSAGFDFEGRYSDVVEHQRIAYVMTDGRKVSVTFAPAEGGGRVTETFDAENENSPELQRQGWQSILDHFARYVEAKA